MTLMISDCGSYQIADARTGSARLLAGLQANHDFNLSPPKSWEPRPAPPPEPKIWFSVIDDHEVSEPEPRVGDIRRAVCKHFGITRINLDSERRTKVVVYPRHIAMYLARELTTRSLPDIGRQFNGRDHSTILHATRKIAALVRADWKVAHDVAHVEALI